MAVNLVIKYNGRSRIVLCECTLEGIQKAFGSEYKVADPQNFIIQRYHHAIEDYIDMDDVDPEMPPHTRLQFVRNVDVQPPRPPDAQDLRGASDEETEGGNLSTRFACGGSELPFHYKLPDFGFTLTRLLEAGKPLDPLYVKRILVILAADMKRFVKDLLPSPQEYQRVAETLVRTYEHLGDNEIVQRRKPKQPDSCASWRKGLRRRFKAFREQSANDPGMEHLLRLKEKFGPRETDEPRARRPRPNSESC